MSKSKNNHFGGLVYSTNAEAMKEELREEIITKSPSNQRLYVYLDKKQRKGKTVTLIDGFEGNENDLIDLSKQLKNKCGTGGSVKTGQIIIQGDYREKITILLREWGYSQTKNK